MLTAAPDKPAPRRFGIPSSVTTAVSCDRFADLRGQRLAALHFDLRRLVGANLRAARSGAERAGLRRAHDIVDLIIEPQARVRFFGLALRGQRPDQFVLVGESRQAPARGR